MIVCVSGCTSYFYDMMFACCIHVCAYTHRICVLLSCSGSVNTMIQVLMPEINLTMYEYVLLLSSSKGPVGNGLQYTSIKFLQ